MESLHLSFSCAIDAGIFTGIKLDSSLTISHLFYADDAVFIGEWSNNNLRGILNILKCFSLLSGLSINLNKSHLLGVGDETVTKLRNWLSKWKLKTLSIGGRLTLLKSVLGSTPIYNMSLFKVPKSVLNTMEGIRRDFFNGIQEGHRKISWTKWSKVLAAKKYGGLGHVFPRLFALESAKDSTVAEKFEVGYSASFCRTVRGGAESHQLDLLLILLEPIILSSLGDRWVCDLNGDGDFRVKDIRSKIDDFFLPKDGGIWERSPSLLMESGSLFSSLSGLTLHSKTFWKAFFTLCGENGNSFKPVPRTTANADGTSTSTIPGLVTTEEKAHKKNDVKARSMLLMALPNEHLLTFSQYKEAKTLFEAIQARFGESLDSIFNRLHKIVSQLAILGENISKKDLNIKFLRSLPSEWNTHVVVWRNKADLDTMSIDDLYNNFKIVKHEVKRTVTTSSSSGSQNMAFLSSSGSTNEVDTTNIQVSAVSTPVSIVNLEQIHEDDLEEIDLKWQLAFLSMGARRYFQRTGKKIIINGSNITGYDKTNVECFNCHKMGDFARECKSPKNQESRPRNQDSSRKTVNVEDTSSKAMVAIDGEGFDWSYMADDEAPTNMADIC
nr:hypothetical protein [Tanacetum cinerariifolium]